MEEEGHTFFLGSGCGYRTSKRTKKTARRSQVGFTREAAGARQRENLEQLCRCIARPPMANERLALTGWGDVRYRLKTPYRDGSTHIVLEPLGEPKPDKLRLPPTAPCARR